MTNEEVERAIEFLIDHHAKVSSDIGGLREAVGELKDVQKQQAENIDRLTADVHALTGNVELMREEMDANRIDLRHAIDNLIIGNEATRDLANKVASLEA
jgi:predicted  nucleic acid-binding Zn-ribbon protein